MTPSRVMFWVTTSVRIRPSYADLRSAPGMASTADRCASVTRRQPCHSGSVLEPVQVAHAYARWIADGEPDFQAMMSPDLRDHVSGMPWLGDRAPSGAQIAWHQLHVFAVDGDQLT